MSDNQGKTKNVLDLVFVVDCTSSMTSYLASAQQNIKKIIEDIISAENTSTTIKRAGHFSDPNFGFDFFKTSCSLW